MEEAGTLCFAVRNRFRGGILYRYVNYEVFDVRQMYELVAAADPAIPVDELLRLPARAQIMARLDRADADRLVSYFDLYGEWLRTTARVYLAQGEAIARAMNKVKHGFVVVEDLGLLGPAPPLSPEDASVILDVRFADRSPTALQAFEFAPHGNLLDYAGGFRRLFQFQDLIIWALELLYASGLDLGLADSAS